MTRHLVLSLVLVASCAADTKTNFKETNGVEVGLLFEYDGCRVYRFYDHSNYHYYTNCNHGSAENLYRHCVLAGKVLTCHDEE